MVYTIRLQRYLRLENYTNLWQVFTSFAKVQVTCRINNRWVLYNSDLQISDQKQWRKLLVVLHFNVKNEDISNIIYQIKVI